jgi:hypothetical protein
VFESNKFVLSKYGTFVGKGYESGGSFRLSLIDTCFNSVNHVSHDVEINIWHSRLCHINFGSMTRLAGLNLILKFECNTLGVCHRLSIEFDLKQGKLRDVWMCFLHVSHITLYL